MDLLKKVSLFYILANKNKEIYEILSEIDAMDTFQDRQDYLEKNLDRLSSGSSRIIFKFDNIVIKLARNKKGIAQNKTESNIDFESKFINKTIDHSKKYYWIMSKYLEDISVSDFKKIFNFEFKDFCDCFEYALQDISNVKKKKPENFNKISKIKFFNDIVNLANKYKLMPGDLIRISSWKKNNDMPILVDLGLSKNVFENFYDSK